MIESCPHEKLFKDYYYSFLLTGHGIQHPSVGDQHLVKSIVILNFFDHLLNTLLSDIPLTINRLNIYPTLVPYYEGL